MLHISTMNRGICTDRHFKTKRSFNYFQHQEIRMENGGSPQGDVWSGSQGHQWWMILWMGQRDPNHQLIGAKLLNIPWFSWGWKTILLVQDFASYQRVGFQWLLCFILPYVWCALSFSGAKIAKRCPTFFRQWLRKGVMGSCSYFSYANHCLLMLVVYLIVLVHVISCWFDTYTVMWNFPGLFPRILFQPMGCCSLGNYGVGNFSILGQSGMAMESPPGLYPV
jgi:hypothetical protein